MASTTPALPDGSKLTKPAYSDSADIAVINTNMDNIATNINLLGTNSNIYNNIIGNDTKSTRSSSQDHSINFPNSARAILIVTGNASVDRFWMGYVYCTASGGIRVKEISAGPRASYSIPESPTNTLVISFDEAQPATIRTINLLGDSVT